MSEQNKAGIREFFEEVWDKRNLSYVDEFFSEDYVAHFLPETLPANREGFKAHAKMWQTALPDAKTEIEDLIAEGDTVVLRWAFKGTHQGELMGIPPSGREGRMVGYSTFRFESGKVVEQWAEADQLGMLIQLGLIQPPW